MGWPRQNDGTVDWDSIFEDPDIGLIAYLNAVETATALGQCAHVMVQSLFIRAEDMSHRMTFNAAIDEVIQTSDTEQQARERLVCLAHEIKANRITYALQFLDREKSGEDLRRNTEDPADVLKVLKE